MKRGFTVVEVMVTLVVIGILLGLGTVGLRSTLANGRDSERKADVESIARGFEQFYDAGIQGKPRGGYPSLNEIWFDIVTNGTYKWTDFAPGTSDATFSSPTNQNGLDLICIFESPSAYWATQPGCETPGIESKIRTSLAGGNYGYQPIQADGGLCYNAGCVAFNLYWISEVDGTLNKVTSKHQ